ncbi:MAG TPA: hypothetical protein VGA08_00050 [Candidatus Saccharimonadales bacterium]
MKKLVGMLMVVVFVAGLTALPVFAVVKSDDTVIVRADEVINDDFFAAGEAVTIEGTINGDVYVGAERLTISGTINGDVIAGANTIEVTGTIRDDLRAGGNNISLIGADIGDSVSIGGNELSIDATSKVDGGLVFGGRLLSLSGPVDRGVTAAVDTVRINSAVGKTARITATNITIDENAVIRGDLEYQSENEPTISGIVRGEVIKGEGRGLNINAETFLRNVAIGFSAWAYVAAALVGGVMMVLAPRAFKKSHQKFMEKPWQTAGWGAVAWLAAVPAAIILFVTIFGIPLGVLTLIAWLVSIYLAKIFVSYSVGLTVFKYFWGKNFKPHAYLALLVGLLLYYGLRILPYVGLPVRLATTVIGLGMIVSMFGKSAAVGKASSS